MDRLGPLSVITLICTALCLGACVYPKPDYDGATKVTFIILDGSPEFTAFVYPRTAPEADAVAAIKDDAAEFCNAFSGTPDYTIVETQNRNYGVPLEWRITGVCTGKPPSA